MNGTVTGLAVLALLAGGSEAARAQDRIEWSDAMASGQVLEVRGIVGDIRTTLAQGSTATVVGTKTGRSRDFDEIDMHVERHGDGVTVCVVYVRRMDPDDPCDWNDDGHRRDRGDRNNVRAGMDFEVRLPAGVELDAGTVSGDVEVRGVRSVVSASSVSGDVVVSTSEVAYASTVSGELDIEMASTAWDDLEFSTVSGDITLYLSEGIQTAVDFESLSGDLRSDFDLRLERRRNRWVGSRVQGEIGDGGGRSLSLHTVNGDVHLYRLRR